MRPFYRALMLLALLAGARAAQAAYPAISTSSGSANGWACQVVTWTDSTGNPRQAWIATTNHKITRLTYYLGGTLITDNEVSGYGLGNLTNHGSCGATVTRLGSGVTSYAGAAALAGGDHYIWRSTFRFAMCGSGQLWRINNDYLFVNGRDDFLQTVTYDSSDVPAGSTMGEDMRGPYNQMTWGGNPNIPVSGVGWGNSHKFRTLGSFSSSPAGCPYSCSGNMAWDWTQPNSIPYVWSWKSPAQGADIDREYGVVQTQKEDEQDFGGAFYGAGNVPASLPAASSAPHAMFECWSAPTQANCYDSPWTSGRMTWGATYGTFNNNHANDRGQVVNKLSFRPINSWSWNHLVDRHSDGGVQALVSDTENIYKSTLSATAPTSIATSGPRAAGNYVGPSVGTMPTVTYPKPGYDFVYRAWTLETAGANALFSLDIPVGASLARPVFVLRAAPGLPCRVQLDGATLVAGSDYGATYDAGTQKLWLTFHSSFAAGSRAVQVHFTCGSPTPTPTYCSACTATPTTTPTPSFTASSTPTPTLDCTPVLIDDMEDNNTQNLLNGWWSTWAGSSTILPSPYAMSAGGHSSSFGARASGTNNLAGQPSLSTSFASPLDASVFSGVSFWFNGDGGSYRFQIHSQVQGTNYNDYKQDFSPPVGWSLVTLPFSGFTHPGWGPAYPLDLTQWLGISWVPLSAGAYAFTVDDVTLVCPLTNSPTPTPTLGLQSPTRTATASASRTATLTASPTATYTASRTATLTASPTSSLTPSASPSVTYTLTASPTEAGTPTPSATPTDYAGTPTSTWTSSETPSVTFSPSASETLTPSPTPTVSATASASPTVSSSSTFSPTLSITPSVTSTSSPDPNTATPTRTPTSSLTATRSATLTLTATLTPQPSPLASATASPSAVTTVVGPPELEALVPWPNPNASYLQFKVKGKVERCRMEVYTPAMVLAYGADLPLPSVGWNQADLRPALPGLASGLYFVRVQVQGGGYKDAAIARAVLTR